MLKRNYWIIILYVISLRFDGSCTCTAGWTGRHCQLICPEGTYGLDCSETCTCENDAYCRPDDGQCECMDGWIGRDCSHRGNKLCLHTLIESTKIVSITSCRWKKIYTLSVVKIVINQTLNWTIRRKLFSQ